MNRQLTKILLVEDNIADSELIQELLAETKSAKFQLTSVERVSEALPLLVETPLILSNKFDVILLDLSLPDSQGLNTVEQVILAAPSIPVVVLTGLNDEEIAVQSVREGAQDYLVKGEIDCNLLVRAIRYAIERKQTLEALRQSEERFQHLAADLDRQVQERTTQLQQALQFESMLKRITDKVRDSLDENQILQTAVQELATVTGVKYCQASLYNPQDNNITICYDAIGNLLKSGRSPVQLQLTENSQVYEQLRHGQYVQFCDLNANPDRETGAILACPIRDHQGVLGDLWLMHQGDYAFNDLEMRLVQQVANQCAIALRQARLYQASLAQVQELERLNRLKDDFLNTVSHELRTPVANIKMAVQMLELIGQQQQSFSSVMSQNVAQATSTEPRSSQLRAKPLHNPGGSAEEHSMGRYYFQSSSEYSQEYTQPETSAASLYEKMKAYLQIVHEECDREICLINDLLDLQRLDAGVQPLDLISLNLQSWIPHIVEPFQQRAQNCQQILQVEIFPDLPPFVGDPEALRRIVTELLNNACKYTPSSSGEYIQLRACLVGDRLQLRVTNTGIEIPTEQLEHVFDKFYRIPTSDPWKQGGTGLGLALVRKLVAHLGGSISVDSGHGKTNFTIEFPFLSPEKTQQ